MAEIYEFMLYDSGDASAGIPSHEERVTIIMHNNLNNNKETEEIWEEAIRDSFDLAVQTYDSYIKDRIEDGIATYKEYEEWKKEQEDVDMP